MGRHSAPDDDAEVGELDDVAVAETTTPLDLAPHRGRHAVSDDEGEPATDERRTQMIAVVDAELVETVETDTHVTDELPAGAVAVPEIPSKTEQKAAKQAEKQQRKAAKKQARGETDAAADLRLLRQHPMVRLQCVAAVLVSFALYWLVMVAIGRTDVFVLWIWTPIVLSGVLVGLVFDLAHRRERRRAS